MEKWIEPLKTLVLSFLVVLSFVLTGLLLYSNPSYMEKTGNDYLPPPYIGELNYNQKSLHELTAPPIFIAHQAGKHTWVTEQNNSIYSALINTAHQVNLESFREITPTATDWRMVFQQASGFEWNYFHDTTLAHANSFFQYDLTNSQSLQSLTTISRIWVFAHPKLRKPVIWFISDADGKVIQATITNYQNEDLQQQIDVIYSDPKTPELEAVPSQGKPPWNPQQSTHSFTRVHYLPSQPLPSQQYTYTLQTIPINDMKQWLFKGANIEPIELNANESVFMDNEQILTYYQQDQSMMYTDASDTQQEENASLNNEIALLNTQFMAKHRGWTGHFLLEHYEQGVTENKRNQYYFRLIKQGFPVYWNTVEDESITPDEIEFIAKTSNLNGIEKYKRSLLSLSDQYTQQTPTTLPSKEQLYQQLAKQSISMEAVKRIFPSYQVTKSKNEKEVLLTPVWMIQTLDGKQIQIGVSS